MPAALYDYTRSGSHRPVRVGGGVVMPSDRQTQDYLLCGDCEDILNRGGESWCLPLFATMQRSFPLYDLLKRQSPDFAEDGLEVYFAAKNPEIREDKLAHFALGIFWKASVHPWRGDTREPRIELGPYSEHLRRWLKGDEPLSEFIVLTMSVSVPLRVQITFSDPYEGENLDGHSYVMHVPGILFMMHVGKNLPSETRAACLWHSDSHPIMVSDKLTDQVEQIYVKSFVAARKTNAFLRAKAARDKELQGAKGPK